MRFTQLMFINLSLTDELESLEFDSPEFDSLEFDSLDVDLLEF